jgi:DNA primase
MSGGNRKPHGPVSTPLAWSKVKPTLNPSSFNIGNFVGSRPIGDAGGGCLIVLV